MNKLEEVVRELIHRGNHQDLADKLDAPDEETAPEKEDDTDAEKS